LAANYAVWNNWIRIHKTLRVTPAMAAGLSRNVMDQLDIVWLMDAEALKPDPRGPNTKHGQARGKKCLN
jgi:hypothetical protein